MLDDTFRMRYKGLPIAVCTTTPDYTNPHNHSEFEVLLFKKGRAEVTVSGKKYAVSGGDMIFINPFEVHSLYFDTSDEQPERICICFDINILINKDIADKISNENLKIMHYIKSGRACEYLKKEFIQLLHSYEEETEWSDTEITAHLSLMFTYLLKNSLTYDFEKNSRDIVFCEKALNYIKRNYGTDITSRDIAGALSYNQSYFCRTFKRNFGRTFSEYLNMYRVANSRIILENKNITISEVAQQCGFNSYTYFSKCFKKYFGILPSEYIKKGIYL